MQLASFEIDNWYEPGPETPYFCCGTPTWSWHQGSMYCESCGRDIPLRSGRECDAHIRARFGLPQLPPEPVVAEGQSEYLSFAREHPEECPACDEPVADSGWDAELGVCTACAEARAADEELSDHEFEQSLEDEFADTDADELN